MPEPAGFAPMGPAPLAGRNDGNELGGHVSDYILDYGDGAQAETPILRRFAIQQRHITWGASPFAAIPARGPAVFTTVERGFPARSHGARIPGAEPRRAMTPAARSTPRTSGSMPCPNPESGETDPRHHPARPGRSARSSTASPRTTLADHPLRPGVRRKLRLTLPEGAALNAIGELDADSRDAGDRDRPGDGHLRPRRARLRRRALGERRRRTCNRSRRRAPWWSSTRRIPPAASTSPPAPIRTWRSIWPTADGTARDGSSLQIEPIAAANRPVRLRVIDKSTRPAGRRPAPPARRGRRVPAAARPPPQGQSLLVRGQLRRVRQRRATSTATSPASASSICRSAASPSRSAAATRSPRSAPPSRSRRRRTS